MSQRYVSRRMVFLFIFLVLTASMISCILPLPGQDAAQEAPTPRVRVDSPGEGSSVSVGAPVTIISQVGVEGDVTEVQLWVNGTVQQRDLLTETSDRPVEIRQEWVPPAPGVYILEVRMYDKTGALRVSERITVDVKGDPIAPTGAAEPTAVRTEGPTETPTPIPTSGPTPIPTDGPTVPPTDGPTVPPTDVPTVPPTRVPTEAPTTPPTRVPTEMPTTLPTKVPTSLPTTPPTKVPTVLPTKVPTNVPTALPTKVSTLKESASGQ